MVINIQSFQSYRRTLGRNPLKINRLRGFKYANFQEKIFAEISGKNVTTMKNLERFSRNLRIYLFEEEGTKNLINRDKFMIFNARFGHSLS